jgi:hypothetical protein
MSRKRRSRHHHTVYVVELAIGLREEGCAAWQA